MQLCVFVYGSDMLVVKVVKLQYLTDKLTDLNYIATILKNFIFRNATVTIQIFSLSLTKKAHELKMEKKKADALTYQMLPRSIAKVNSQ